MKKVFILLVCLALLVATLGGSMADQTAGSQVVPDVSAKIHIVPANTQPPVKGAATNFTGNVSVVRLFPADDPLKISGGYVTFQPGARTAWHTHPNGQMLIVTAGTGYVQQWSDLALKINTGDVVWIPAGVKHWHGATPNTALTHISLADIVDGKSSEWLELVSAEQYSQ